MGYRPEIEGLRAVAVVPVLLFHAGLPAFSGGFVGVDVFFVISGYLIAIILLEELEGDRFSLPGFYERRMRRIFPALFFMMLVCSFVAWLWLLPGQLNVFFETMAATALFVSNLEIASQTGYFHPAAEYNPLLHTWSLAVEVQFYLIFPLLLLAIRPLGRRGLGLVLAGVAAVSFALADWGWRTDPGSSFYPMPLRAWELLIGALCALAGPPPVSKLRGDACAAAGLAMILAAVFAFDETTPFPSAYTLLPVVGTALVLLFARHGGATARLLSHPAPVGIGLISYSAYLWHQPILAFARARMLLDPSTATMAALALSALPLGYLSWRFVERPFRGPRPSVRRRRAVFAAGLAASTAFAVIGVAGSLAMQGGPDRLAGINQGGLPICRREAPQVRCTDGDGDGGEAVVVYGDSYAGNLVNVVLRMRPDAKIYQATKSACSPVRGLAQIRPPSYGVSWAEGCIAFNENAARFLRGLGPSTVVVSSPFANTVANPLLLAGGQRVETGQLARTVAGLRETLRAIRSMGHRIVLVAPAPNSGLNIGNCLAKAEKFGADPKLCDFDEAALSQRSRIARAVISALEDDMPVLRLGTYTCREGRCSARLGEAWLYRDWGHLSKEGSHALAGLIGWDGLLEHAAPPLPAAEN